MEQPKRLATYLFTAISGIAVNAHAAVIINEFDYDQPGADTAEFIELFNSGGLTISLDSYTIELINGSNAASYRSINLTGFSINTNDYFVICSDTSLVANCDYSISASSSWLQNGAPDAIALFDGVNLQDSVSYEGALLPYTQGDALAIKDNGSDIFSISRFASNNNNFLDYDSGCLTPGSQNIAGIGDCSMTSVSAVPIPAAAWLFGSGFLGLMSFARREKVTL